MVMPTFAEFLSEKYNKSETRLMSDAQSSPDGTVTVTTHIHKGAVKNVRLKNAFHKLLAKGDLSQTGITEPHQIQYGKDRSGNHRVSHTFTGELTQTSHAIDNESAATGQYQIEASPADAALRALDWDIPKWPKYVGRRLQIDCVVTSAEFDNRARVWRRPYGFALDHAEEPREELFVIGV